MFVSLVTYFFSWSLSTPAGSEPDGPFHYSIIWCLRDSPKPGCTDPNLNSPDPRLVSVSVWDQMCFRDQLHRSAKCGVGSGSLSREIDESSYPRGFYQTMNLFAHSNISLSTLIMRGFNSVVAALLYIGAFLISAGRLRQAFVLSLLLTLGPLHLSLIPMVHAQSWLIPALGTIWVFVTVVTDTARQLKRRLVAGALWFVCLAVGIGSRLEGVPLLLTVSGVALAGSELAREWVKSKWSKRVVPIGLLSLILVQFGDSILSYKRWVGSLPVSLEPVGGPNIWSWFSSWVVGFPAVVIEMYGTQGFANEMRPPLLLVPVIGGFLLSWALVSQLAQITPRQIGIFVAWSSLSLVCILYFTKSGLDLIDIDARYVTQFAHPFLGMFLLFGVNRLPMFDDTSSRSVFRSLLLTSGFLSQFFFIERYVNGVSHGFRALKVGIDSWWWLNIPIGPNGVLLVGVGSLFIFMKSLLHFTDRQQQSSAPADELGRKCS